MLFGSLLSGKAGPVSHPLNHQDTKVARAPILNRKDAKNAKPVHPTR